MNLTSIKQSIENMSFEWNDPKSYLVFVPVVSLGLQKIQMANILPLKTLEESNSYKEINKQSRKFSKICRWHLSGSMLQSMVLTIAAVANPAFLLLAIPAAYEMIDTLIKTYGNTISIYEFYETGVVKSVSLVNPISFF